VLIFDLIGSPSHLTDDALYIDTGLRTIEMLKAKQSILNYIGIQTMVTHLLNIARQRASQDHDSFGAEESDSPTIYFRLTVPIQANTAQPFIFHDRHELSNADHHMTVDSING